jgi:hypothetical protein
MKEMKLNLGYLSFVRGILKIRRLQSHRVPKHLRVAFLAMDLKTARAQWNEWPWNNKKHCFAVRVSKRPNQQ